jgi:glycosyltransferase involved in cell wall biosynthesis
MNASADGAGETPRTRRRVAVCVVTYNQIRYIADCLLSILSQDVDADVTVWVGDDGSTDGTTESVATIARAWPGRVNHVVHATRHGPVGNYRAIITAAEGDFIAHLDGDDFWLPGKLREQLSLLDAEPASSASCTNAFVFDDARQPMGIFTNAPSRTMDTAYLLRRGNFLNHSSLVYRAEHREAILSLVPPFIDYRILLTLCRGGPIVYTSKTLVGYRANASGSMLANANEAVRQQYFEAMEEALPGVTAKVRAEACADMLRRVVFRAIRGRDMRFVAEWWPRLLASSGERRLSLIIRASGLVLLEGMRQVIQAASSILLRSRLRVLYFR